MSGSASLYLRSKNRVYHGFFCIQPPNLSGVFVLESYKPCFQLSNFRVCSTFETDEGERTTGKLTGGGGEADREPGRYSAELDSYGNDHVIDARNFPSEIHRAEFHTVQNSFRVRQMAVPVAQSENWHLLFLKKKKERINATLQSPIGRPARLEGIARPSTPNSSGHPAPAQRLRFS